MWDFPHDCGMVDTYIIMQYLYLLLDGTRVGEHAVPLHCHTRVRHTSQVSVLTNRFYDVFIMESFLEDKTNVQ